MLTVLWVVGRVRRNRDGCLQKWSLASSNIWRTNLAVESGGGDEQQRGEGQKLTKTRTIITFEIKIM